MTDQINHSSDVRNDWVQQRANQILQDELQKGPITGTAVKPISAEPATPPKQQQVESLSKNLADSLRADGTVAPMAIMSGLPAKYKAVVAGTAFVTSRLLSRYSAG